MCSFFILTKLNLIAEFIIVFNISSTSHVCFEQSASFNISELPQSQSQSQSQRYNFSPFDKNVSQDSLNTTAIEQKA